MPCHEAEKHGDNGETQTDAQRGDDFVRSIILYMLKLVLDLRWRRRGHCAHCVMRGVR